MRNIRINRIRLHNFKGVRELDLELTHNAIILGGKNGFGKTTIFDALELLFTGKIDRYADYSQSFADRRRSYSDKDRPFVCDNALENVKVEAFVTISLDDGQTVDKILMRQARTQDLRPPVKFDVFKYLYIREDEQQQPELATAEILQELKLEHFQKYYGRINYMSQEEATHFIKSKDTERVKDVQFLFNTAQFDRRINKIDKVLLKALKSKMDATNSQMEQKRQTIQMLRQYGVGEAGEAQNYQRLFNENVRHEWDAEEPRLNHDQYSQLLREDGLLDSIQGMIAKQEDFRRYRYSVAIARILSVSSDYAFYLQFRPKASAIKRWRTFHKQTVEPFTRLALQHIGDYRFELEERLKDLIDDSLLESTDEGIKAVRSNYQAATSAQQAYNQMTEQRNRLSQMLKDHAVQLAIKRCPLCGQSFASVEDLLKAVDEALGIQLSSLSLMNDQVAQTYNHLKGNISKIIEQIEGEFRQRGITKEIVEKYEGLNTADLEKDIQYLTERGVLNDFPKPTMEETERLFREVLEKSVEPYEEQLDYGQMNDIFDGYVRDIPKDLRTIVQIQKKRSYLLQKWNYKKSQQLSMLDKEVTALQKLQEQYAQLRKQLSEIKDTIVEQKNEYLKKVISDVEILFFIYSGRIMQDSFYGRGLFMKNREGKYIYFVSDYESDLDALYKMSSGQLVALMIALLLSLNKLYSEGRVLAIDDPVQTIDDINVWGFVETLRHEFKDYQFLFSTHELSYGSFLRYKLNNMGINAKYIDMMDLRKNSPNY